MTYRCDEITFIALAAWREARGAKSDFCIAGVVHSILNRVNRPSWWGSDIMTVVFKKWQYSSMTDPHDRQLTTWPKKGEESWERCLRIAQDVLAGKIANPVPGADSYHDTSISPPAWTMKGRFVSQIDRILFYDMDFDYENIS